MLEPTNLDESGNESSSSDQNYDEKIKIMLIGQVNVGKTSLIRRYTKNTFGGTFLTTVGIDFQEKVVNIDKKSIQIQIWNTAGEERFRNIAKNYYNSSDGFLIVYDITDKNALEKLKFWYEQIQLNAPKNIKYVLVGNKCDLEEQREVSKDEGINYSKEFKCKFYETSAKEGINVNEIFQCLINDIYKDAKNNENRNKIASQVLKKQKTLKKKIGC